MPGLFWTLLVYIVLSAKGETKGDGSAGGSVREIASGVGMVVRGWKWDDGFSYWRKVADGMHIIANGIGTVFCGESGDGNGGNLARLRLRHVLFCHFRTSLIFFYSDLVSGGLRRLAHVFSNYEIICQQVIS